MIMHKNISNKICRQFYNLAPTKFNIPRSYGSLIIAVKRKAILRIEVTLCFTFFKRK